MELQVSLLIFLSLISLIIIGGFFLLKRDWTYKIIILGIGFSTFIYSGIGISLTDVDDKYAFSYILYIISILFGFYIFNIKSSPNEKIQLKITYGEINLNYIIFIVFTIIYFMSQVLFLIFPEFRLINLIIPPSVNVYGVRYLRTMFQSNTILNISNMVSVLTLPFFFILLNQLIKNKKYKLTLFLIIFWLYLDYVIFEYIGRSSALTVLFFAYLVLQTKTGELKLKSKHLFIASVFLVFITPLLYWYESIRLKQDFNISNLLSSYSNLFLNEITYPQYYDFILEGESLYGIKNYLFWIITLPIPKMLVPIEITPFNTFFTNLVDEHLDYIVLPSILGEAFMIFGENLFWLHGLIIGSIIGISYKILKSYDFTLVILIYIGVLTFSIGRGGSMEIISFCINCLFTIWILILFSKLLRIAKKY